MLYRSLSAFLLLSFSATNFAAAASPLDEGLAASRLKLVNLEAEGELNNLSAGLSVRSALQVVKERADDSAFWANFMATHKISPARNDSL